MSHPVTEYWEGRYRAGGGSGKGSRGERGLGRAAYVNEVIQAHQTSRVIDWGCGDGWIASRISAPEYVGLEVSARALELCKARADGPGREWMLFDPMNPPSVSGDLALSMDVIFHLTDDALYHKHLEALFGSAPLVCISSPNRHEQGAAHVLYREFVRDVPDGWQFSQIPEAARGLDFWVLRREGEGR